MSYIVALGKLEIRFISVSNHRKKTLESDVGNILKEFAIFIFDKDVLKVCDRTVSMYRETRSFEPYVLHCMKCFSAFRLVNLIQMRLCYAQYFGHV